MEVESVTMPSVSAILFWPLVVTSAVLAAVYYYLETSRHYRLGSKLPGPKPLPFFGNTLMLFGVQPKDVLKEVRKHDIYGHVVRLFIGPRLYVLLSDPRDVEIILSSRVHLQKSTEYRFFGPWLGDGLLVSTGDKWQTHRKFIASSFHLSILKSFVPIFYQNSIELVQKMKKEVGKEFDVHHYMSGVTVDILIETAMGVTGTKKEKSLDYAMAVMNLCNIIHRRQYNILLRPDFFYQFSSLVKEQVNILNTIHSLVSRVISKRKEQYYNQVEAPATEPAKKEEAASPVIKEVVQDDPEKFRYMKEDFDEMNDQDVGEKRRLAFLDVMLEMRKNGENLTDEEIQQEVNTIMFEGHDTMAAATSFMLCILGIHKDIQDRVAEELDEIFQGSDRPCTYEDTLEMKYLERVTLETLRLFPPVPLFARTLAEDMTIATKGYLIPKGSTVVISPYRMQRNEKNYPNAMVFNPDNFLPENTRNRHYYSFIPFSAGPRSCVGHKYAMLKLKVLMSTLLRNYRISSSVPEKDFQLQLDIILKRADGFKINIEPRKRTVVA